MIKFLSFFHIAIFFLVQNSYGNNNYSQQNLEKGMKIMKRVFDIGLEKPFQEADVKMIITKKNKDRIRSFKSLKHKTLKQTKTLIEFYDADVKGTKLITKAKNDTKEKTQWYKVPALPISQLNTSSQNNSFMGSDFSYSDIAGRTLKEDDSYYMGEDDKYFFVTSIPKDKKDKYSKLDIIVDKETSVIKRITFFNKNNEVLKVLTNKKIENIDGIFVVTESTMKNSLRDSQTTLVVKSMKFPNNILSSNFDPTKLTSQ